MNRLRALWLALATTVVQPLVVGDAAADLVVPANESLSAGEYMDLGVADPTRSWTAQEYVGALRVLGALHRPALPRASGESRLLFERLVLSYRNIFLLESEIDQAAALSGAHPPSLHQLYSTTQPDRLFFDTELVSIRAAALDRSLTALTPRDDLRARVRELAWHEHFPLQGRQPPRSEPARVIISAASILKTDRSVERHERIEMEAIDVGRL